MKHNLLSPLKLRELELKNRIVMSPMQQYSSPGGIVSDWHMVHIGSRAVGGAGLIITESSAVHPVGRATRDDAGIWTEEQAAAWKPIIDFVHTQDCRIAIQLSHFGSKASKSLPEEGFRYISPDQGGWQTVSSSASAPFPGMSAPRALTLAEIAQIPPMFAEAAARAVHAGFDAVEIHAAHGYLLHQFYSAIINRRTDAYGGDFDNRARLPLEVARAVRRAIPAGMPLLVRLSAVDYLDDDHAWRLDDTLKLAALLQTEGVDFITASAGGFVFLDASKVSPGYQVPFAAALKELGIATGAVGMITGAQQANAIVEREQADAVVVAREFLRNPYFGVNAALALDAAPRIPWQYKRAY